MVPLETRGHMSIFAPLTEVLEGIQMLNLL